MVKWIFEKYLFDSYENELVDIINKNNSKCYLMDDTDIFKFDMKKYISKNFSDDDIVFFYGSLQKGQYIYRYTKLYPGVFLSLDNYECFKYYGYYGNELVNSDYMLFGLNDIIRSENKEKIFNSFNTDKIFIRPSNGYKTFTGQLVPKDDWESELDILKRSYGGTDVDQLVLLSSQKNVVEEHRFMISNSGGSNHIIDGNLYMVNGELIDERIIDENAYKYVEKIINNYTPDKLFTIDIAKMDNGEYKILEIGSLSCASWYNVDLDKVVKEVNKVCELEYNDVYQ